MRRIAMGMFLVSGMSWAVNDTQDSVDVGNSVTQRPLMRTGAKSVRGAEEKQLYKDIGFARFEVLEPGAPVRKAQAWCASAASLMQQGRGNTDAKTGEARMTVESLREACSSSYSHDMAFDISCGFENRKEGPKDKEVSVRYAVCKGKSTLKFEHLIPEIAETQLASGGGPETAVAFREDKGFGKDGVLLLQRESEGASKVDPKEKNADEKAMESARRGAYFDLTNQIRRGIRDVPDFQIHAPIAGIKSGKLANCIADEVGFPDMPMLVVVGDASKQGQSKTFGFAKMRQMKDGCVAAPGKTNIGPSEAQLILGGSDVKAGMTLWEMPTAGLNFSAAPAFRTIGSAAWLGARVGGEFSLSQMRWVPLSETYAIADLDIGVIPGEQSASALVVGTVGALKRFYLAGPLFADVSLNGGYAYSPVSDTVRWGGATVGASGGLGLQVAPRFMLRLTAGYALTLLRAEVKNTATDEWAPIEGTEVGGGGLNSALSLSYTY